MKSMKPLVTLDQADLEVAFQLANSTFERYKNLYGYYNNTPNSHLKGRLGELAVQKYLLGLGVALDPVFRDLTRDKECDIDVVGCRLEVKTWSAVHWLDLGRCIAARQLPALSAKADAIVWCTTSFDGGVEAEIQIEGFSFVDSISSAPRLFTGTELGRKVDNFQVENHRIREIRELPIK